MDDCLFLEDPADPRSRALIEAGNEAVRERLHDGGFDRDVALLKAIIEDEDKLFVCRLRAGHLYDFHRSPDHPHGLWRRLPEGTAPTAGADWEPVF
ncbi:MAG: S9 family peptidase, partial [Pseudomonadota bacterium]